MSQTKQYVMTYEGVKKLETELDFLKTVKRKEITEKSKKLEEKQKEIIDSIYYARRIQRALLTSEKYIERNLNKLIKKL
jgi:transcription elongation GreA/GreB family factor